jgi:hypothetical protein
MKVVLSVFLGKPKDGRPEACTTILVTGWWFGVYHPV